MKDCYIVTAENVGEVLFLPRSDVDRLLSTKDCLERCVETLRWIGEGQVDQVNPVRLQLSPPEGPYGWGVVIAFPSYVKPLKIAGIKWLGNYRQNRKRGLPFHSSINIISDAETAMPLAIIDGTSVTGMRTASYAGVGAKYLARKDSRVIAIIGCGLEGQAHLRIINELFSMEEVRAFDIIKEVMDNFKKEMSEELKLDVKTFSSAKEAVKGANIICMVTTALETVVMEEWVEPGCHVCATNLFNDLDPNCAMKFDKWVVGWHSRDIDWIERLESERLAPEVRLYFRQNIYADLVTDIIPGKKPGRETDEERTVMTPDGIPALDAAMAALVYEKAKEAGLGTTLKLF